LEIPRIEPFTPRVLADSEAKNALKPEMGWSGIKDGIAV
jgi:hypothetical protein